MYNLEHNPPCQYCGKKVKYRYSKLCKMCWMKQLHEINKYTPEKKVEALLRVKEYKKQYFQKNKVKIMEKRKQKPLSKEKRDNYQLKYLYGITKDEFDAFYIVQKGKCGICGIFLDYKTCKTKPYIDHDHKTGKIRLLLCQNCNLGIGLLKDNPEVLRRAANYVEGK